MQYHKYPHHGAAQRGEYSSKPWKGIPCAKGRLGEDTFYPIPFDEDYFCIRFESVERTHYQAGGFL